MKNKICLISTIIVLVIGCNKLYAQTKTSSEKGGVTYSCDTVKTNNEMTLATLIGNVSFHTKDLNLVKAGKVVYDMKNRKITAYNVASFAFNGSIKVNPQMETIGVLEYSIGDDKLSIR
jgi:lipopolysaccharide export system protein LptA